MGLVTTSQCARQRPEIEKVEGCLGRLIKVTVCLLPITRHTLRTVRQEGDIGAGECM